MSTDQNRSVIRCLKQTTPISRKPLFGGHQRSVKKATLAISVVQPHESKVAIIDDETEATTMIVNKSCQVCISNVIKDDLNPDRSRLVEVVGR